MAIDRTNPTQVATNGSGNVLDDVAVTSGTAPTTRRRQVISLGDADSAGIDSIADVISGNPTGAEFALVTKAIGHSGVKGTSGAAALTSTASGANHQPQDVILYDASGNAIIGQKAMAGSVSVVVASDQSNVPAAITAISGVAIGGKAVPTNGQGQAAMPVYNNAIQLATYKSVIDNIVSGALTANTRKDIWSLEHGASATKTVKIRRIVLGAYQTTALAGVVYFKLFTGTAASSAGSAVTAIPTRPGTAAAEAVAKTLPTITAAGGPELSMVTGFLTAAANTGFAAVVMYDWQESGETIPITLRPGVLDTVALAVFSNVAMNLNVFGFVTFTEE